MVTGHGIDMRDTLRKLPMLGLLAVVLSGCAGARDAYPSLALRPFETRPAAAVPPPAPPIPNRPAAVSPALLAELRQRAAASHTAFLDSEPRAERLVRAASGQAFESNARAAALVALADLDAQRGTTLMALAEIDALTAEAGTNLAADQALDEAQNEIAALIAREDTVIARLWEAMGS
jgi:hypothetical protein